MKIETQFYALFYFSLFIRFVLHSLRQLKKKKRTNFLVTFRQNDFGSIYVRIQNEHLDHTSFLLPIYFYFSTTYMYI